MENHHNQVAEVSLGIKKFFDNVFSNVHIEGPELDAAEIQKSPVMVVSTHRSHVDYFFVGNNLFQMGFKNLRFAAGDNLTKLPWIGPRFRAFGAFTVSRDKGFERNYVRKLCADVVKMLENQNVVLVFPEGGRSYSGSMLEIKGGVLNAALLSQASDLNRDVYLLPVAVSYDCPPDVPFFPLLLKGKKYRKKSNRFFTRMLGDIYYFGADIIAFARFFLAKRLWYSYGSIYMDYDSPIPVKSIVDLETNRVQKARDEFSAHRASLDKVSEVIYNKFISLYRILPVHIVCAALKTSGEMAVWVAELENRAQKLKAAVRKAKQNTRTLDSLTEEQIVKEGLKQLRKLKAVHIKRGKVTAVKPHVIDYFAAAIIQQEENNSFL
ncbi:MAG: 1-acyl-sn-glycerol-3-phosphate acyltransferase [Chitinispirillales bacterium]|jgi:1-acyl-sn-glycerol-3-phosphate acyltransferase|nr:1-acyl-sn-glycerol-3-phosphate acyltransferase [Chitinispirillales bacterium]